MDWLSIILSIFEQSQGCLTADFGISAILTTIGLAISAASAATSAGMAAKSAKDARRKEEKNRAEIEEEQRKHEAIFNRRYHQDMTERTEVQGMLRELRERQDAQRNQNEARGAVLGETKEQQIAEQDSMNKSFADSVAQIASDSSMLKDGYLDAYDNSLSNYYQNVRDHNTRMSEIEMNRSNQWATAASNAVEAAAGGAQALAGMVGGGPAKAPAVPAGPSPEAQAGSALTGVPNKIQMQNPTKIGNNGMQMNPDGSLSNPKLNSWDAMQQNMQKQYSIGQYTAPKWQSWQGWQRR